MLSSPVYAELNPRQPVSPARSSSISFRRSQRSNVQTFQCSNVLSIHPLCFQTLPHSFPQWTTPISFPFNRFHTLSIVMGGGTLAFKNLNHHFNLSSSLQAAPFHQNYLRPFASTTYKLPIFYPLCFDIHPCNGGWVGVAPANSPRRTWTVSVSPWKQGTSDRFHAVTAGNFGGRLSWNDTKGLARTTGSSSMIPVGNQEACRQRRSPIQ